MFKPLSKPASRVAALLLSIPGAAAVLADEPTVVQETETADTMAVLLKDILGDPKRNFDRYYGPDDCATEPLYVKSADRLGSYADAPEEQQQALRSYIESGREQCNCTRAIVGKDFDILVRSVGSDMSQIPCP
jgi:hypothetical protein